MAIIFNLGGFIAGAVCVIAIIFLLDKVPGLDQGPYGDLLAGGVIFTVGAAFELTPLKPRIFLIPVWLLGLGTIGIQLWKIWHWPGLAVALAIMGLAIVLAVQLGNRIAARDLAKRIAAKDELLSRADATDDVQVRKTVSTLLIDERAELHTPEAVKINADLIAFTLQRYPQLFTPEKVALLSAYQAKLLQASQSPRIDWQAFKESEDMATMMRAVLA